MSIHASHLTDAQREFGAVFDIPLGMELDAVYLRAANAYRALEAENERLEAKVREQQLRLGHSLTGLPETLPETARTFAGLPAAHQPTGGRAV